MVFSEEISFTSFFLSLDSNKVFHLPIKMAIDYQAKAKHALNIPNNEIRKIRNFWEVEILEYDENFRFFSSVSQLLSPG